MEGSGQNPVQSESDPLLPSGSFIARNGQNPTAVVTPEKGKRKTPEGDLEWLPSGWTFEDRVRASGATAGCVDRYYLDPVSRRKFRSKKEVLYFIQTGTLRKRGKAENSDADTQPTENNGDKKQPTEKRVGKKQKTDKPRGQKQKPNKTEKNGSALNFNFTKVPDKVQWVLTDSPVESWNAVIGDKQVPDSEKLDWLAAFTFLASKDRGRYH